MLYHGYRDCGGYSAEHLTGEIIKPVKEEQNNKNNWEVDQRKKIK